MKPVPLPVGLHSKSTPNLPTLQNIRDNNAALQPGQQDSPEIVTSPSEPASIDDFVLDPSLDQLHSDSDSASDSEDLEQPSKLPPRLNNKHYSRSNPHLAPSTFYPPFYNRPPTPLPPSPSLTSLLRPNFSTAANSRPTTPDPSSDEGAVHPTGTGAQTPNSILTSTLGTAKPIARASPQVPTYEYYGFTLYLTSSLAFMVYILWSFLPSPFLHQLGIYYYPNRWWALAIPAWTVMLLVYIYVALASYNTGYLTLPMNSLECLVDGAANIAVVDEKGQLIRDERASWDTSAVTRGSQSTKTGKRGGRSRRGSLVDVQELDWRSLWNEGTDAVMDVPIGGVCEILYGGHREDETPGGDM